MTKTLIVESDDDDNADKSLFPDQVVESPLTAASTAKAAGVAAAKEGNIQYAASLFRHGATVIKSAFWTPGTSSPLLTDERIAEREMLIACLLNLSMMHLQALHWMETEDVCSEVLSLDPNQPKALFRRCKARIKLELFDGAASDLYPLLMAEPHNPKLVEMKDELDKHGENLSKLITENQTTKTSAHEKDGKMLDQEKVEQAVGNLTEASTSSAEPCYYELSWNPSSGEDLGVVVNQILEHEDDSEFSGLPVVEEVEPQREGEVWYGDVVVGINGGSSSMERLVEVVSEARELDQSVTLKMMRLPTSKQSKPTSKSEDKDEAKETVKELDGMLATIAKQASSMLSTMSITEKQEFAAMLNMDLAGLERLTSDVQAAASASLKVENHTESKESSLQAVGGDLTSTAEETEVLMMKEPPLSLAPYQLAEGWLEQQPKEATPQDTTDCSVPSPVNEQDVIFPEKPIDMKTLVQQMKVEKQKENEDSCRDDPISALHPSVMEVPLSEVEESMKAKFEMIKKFKEMKMKEHLKEVTKVNSRMAKSRSKSSSSAGLNKSSSYCPGVREVPHTGKKSVSMASSQRAGEAWQALNKLEDETRQVFKERVSEKEIKTKKKSRSKEGQGFDKTKGNDKITKPSPKVKTSNEKASAEWQVLLAEEKSKVGMFKKKVVGQKSSLI